MIYDTIYSALSPLNYPVQVANEKLSIDTLEDTFISYQIIDSPSSTFADNNDTGITYRIQVNFYSRDVNLVQSAPLLVDNAMRSNGFKRVNGNQIPQNSETLHFGWRCDYRYYERI